MFLFVFYGLCILCFVLFLLANSSAFCSSNIKNNQIDPISSNFNSATFRSFQKTYLIVYLSATAGDWLQGPHVYALYQSYGMEKHEIELLFIAGYGSSMIFGTFVGSVADKYGRRRNCFLYGLLYGIACVTKHFANFWILFFGRVLCGMATSILYSAFESWVICEHGKRGFGDGSLSTLFGCATFGNSVVAIGAGIVAQVAADRFGYVAPFDVALAVLFLTCVLLVFTWSENYGDAKASFGESFKEAWRYLREDRRIVCLGLIQSLFEGAMYIFVLEWTPALAHASSVSTVNDESNSHSTVSIFDSTFATQEITTERREGFIATIPHGFIFATFMVAVMSGSSLFRILCRVFKPEYFMRFIFLVASLSLLPPIICPSNLPIVFAGFITFETCVGIFWPAMSFMRGIYVPEGARSTLMSFFRVPLNLIVVAILFNNLRLKWIFQFCVLFLATAGVFQHILYRSVFSTTIFVVPKPLPVAIKGLASSSRNIRMELL